MGDSRVDALAAHEAMAGHASAMRRKGVVLRMARMLLAIDPRE